MANLEKTIDRSFLHQDTWESEIFYLVKQKMVPETTESSRQCGSKSNGNTARSNDQPEEFLGQLSTGGFHSNYI